MRHDLKEGDALEFGGVQLTLAAIRGKRITLESTTVIKKVPSPMGQKLRRSQPAPLPLAVSGLTPASVSV